MMRQYGKNAYRCSKCNFYFVTIDRDEGVTPMMTKCQNPVGSCLHAAESSFYRVDQNLIPTFEWYRPLAELNKLSPGAREHVLMGGLLLRPIVEAPEAQWLANEQPKLDPRTEMFKKAGI